LDNVIDASHFPLPQIEQATRRTRKIGLGVMGFADALIRLGVSYDSPLAVAWAERFMSTIARESKRASAHLAATRGPFPEFEKSRLATQNHSPQRNATTNTVAPTGTISIIAGCSSGIEPLFALAYKRNILEGRQFWEVHPLLGELARTHDLDFSGIDPSSLQNAEKDDLSEQLEQRFPASLKKNLITAHQIPPAQHVRIQAAFQKHVDNSVSKTINLPAFAPPEKVVETIGQAYALGVKGLTFYRDRSRKKQAIEHHPGPARRPAAHAQESDPAVDARGPQAPAGGPPCPDCGSKTYRGRQCLACPQCGWSRCT
jgi:ribonucleoside-diphosphate reductase alpha chain